MRRPELERKREKTGSLGWVGEEPRGGASGVSRVFPNAEGRKMRGHSVPEQSKGNVREWNRRTFMKFQNTVDKQCPKSQTESRDNMDHTMFPKQ